MKKQKQAGTRFQTHIPESRSLQIVSIIIVSILVVVEALILLKFL